MRDYNIGCRTIRQSASDDTTVTFEGVPTTIKLSTRVDVPAPLPLFGTSRSTFTVTLLPNDITGSDRR
jgi:hypothetical protein